MEVLLKYRLIATTRRLTFDIKWQHPRVTFMGEDDGDFFKFVASNGYEVISCSCMDIQTERLWLLGATHDEESRSGSMVFSSDEKRDRARLEFVKALNEWARANGGTAIDDEFKPAVPTEHQHVSAAPAQQHADKEAIYDEQISPLMRQLLEICQREKIPMFASFQFSEYGFCTSALPTGHYVFQHYQALSQCAQDAGVVNVDKYMNWVAKDAYKHGHSSIYLQMAGIPTTPGGVKEQQLAVKCSDCKGTGQPIDEASSLFELTDEDRAILEAVRREMGESDDANAPGHAHQIPGIWDEDNGDLAGTPCAWCLTWAKFTALVAIERDAGLTHGLELAPLLGIEPLPSHPPVVAADVIAPLLKAAQSVLDFTEIQHRPPVRDQLEIGRMVRVRLHSLADLNEAVQAMQQNDQHDAMKGAAS